MAIGIEEPSAKPRNDVLPLYQIAVGISTRCCQSTSVAESVAETWRRIKQEFKVELPILGTRWRLIVLGATLQYVHGMFTQLAHRMHVPQEKPLHDLGFEMTPELGPEKHWVSESIFTVAFVSFCLWTLSPFVTEKKRFYSVVLWSRMLVVLVVCQMLRVVTFSVTQLPGSSFHCRANEPTSHLAWPNHWSGHFLIDVSRQATKGCGDLIFSSHTTFVLTGVLAYNEYGSLKLAKVISWMTAACMCMLIIASRKHYTVDIVIAWYTVPLVFYTLYRRWNIRRALLDTYVLPPDEAGPENEIERVLMPPVRNMKAEMSQNSKGAMSEVWTRVEEGKKFMPVMNTMSL